MKHIFAIHQPNYLPWIGYFNKINNCDSFVILDAIQVPRGQSYANRNKILDNNGDFYLTVSLKKNIGSEGKFSYIQAQYSDPNWKEKHLKSMEFAYKKAPFFNDFFPLLHNLYKKDNLSFCEHNIEFIRLVCSYFSINTKLILLSEILENFGEKNNLIIDIGNAIKSNIYFCGKGGGLNYTDPEILLQHNITTLYSSFTHPVYKQFNSEVFISHLSILDYIFNMGNANPVFLQSDLIK